MNLILKDFTILTLKEHKEILNIRNNKHIKSHMKTQSSIEIENHVNWIEKLKNDLNNIYYAVFYENIIVGAIYITEIDYILKKCTWGLYFKENINPFISSITTYLIIDKVFLELDLNILNLEVKKSNTNAYQFDLTFGFEVYNYHQNSEFYLMRMSKESWNKHKNVKILNRINKKIDKINYRFQENKNTQRGKLICNKK